MMEQIKQLKISVDVTTAKAADMLQAITMSQEHEEPWGWANSTQWLKPLRDASTALQRSKQTHKFWKDVVIRDDLQTALNTMPMKTFLHDMHAAQLEFSTAEEKLAKEVRALDDHRRVNESKSNVEAVKKPVVKTKLAKRQTKNGRP